ncbi:MAG: hypothetical protein A07HN63_01582 [uncultured archaeon A07HN63]|nr:MAG: hypothetical protein A07HN63_01582 [uncultured archaeon A07HN63]
MSSIDFSSVLTARFSAACSSRPPRFGDRVELVDKEDTRREPFGDLEGLLDVFRRLAEILAGNHRELDLDKRQAEFVGQGAGDGRLAGSRRADEQQLPDLAEADGGEVIAVLDGLDDLLDLVFLIHGEDEVFEGHLDLLGGAHGDEIQHLGVVVLVEVLREQRVDPDAVGLNRAVVLAGRLVTDRDAVLVFNLVDERRIRLQALVVGAFEIPLHGHLGLGQRDLAGELLALGEQQAGDSLPRSLDAGGCPGGALGCSQRAADLAGWHPVAVSRIILVGFAIGPEYLSEPWRQIVLVQ